MWVEQVDYHELTGFDGSAEYSSKSHKIVIPPQGLPTPREVVLHEVAHGLVHAWSLQDEVPGFEGYRLAHGQAFFIVAFGIYQKYKILTKKGEVNFENLNKNVVHIQEISINNTKCVRQASGEKKKILAYLMSRLKRH